MHSAQKQTNKNKKQSVSVLFVKHKFIITQNTLRSNIYIMILCKMYDLIWLIVFFVYL